MLLVCVEYCFERMKQLNRAVLVDERATDLAHHDVVLRSVDEEGPELPRRAHALRDPHGELRRVVVGHAHVAGPLAREDRIGGVAGERAEHDHRGRGAAALPRRPSMRIATATAASHRRA